jgi:adenosylhomocysteine nucleosidase
MKILIQGATPDEIDKFLEYYNPTKQTKIASYEFYETEYNGHTIIIALTEKGIINATIATTIAALNFKPDLLINQGCAGAHIPELKLGDIIVGECSKYINDFKTQPKAVGEGSSSLTWTPHKSRSYATPTTSKYVEIAKQVTSSHDIYFGALASADTFSRECDRINYLHSCFNHLSEDMESAATMKVCEEFNIDRIAFRIISNNELTLIPFDETTRQDMQQFVIDFVDLIK